MKNITLATILALIVIAVPTASYGAGPCYSYLGYEFKGVDEIKQVNCSDSRKSKTEAEQDRANHLQQIANSKAESERIEVEKQTEFEVKVNEAVKKEIVSQEVKDEQAKQIAELTAILNALIIQLAELKAKLGIS